MRKQARFLILFIAIVWGGKGFSQITSCGFALTDSPVCSPVVLIATPQEVVNGSTITSRIWTLTTCTGTLVYITPPGFNSTFSTVISTPGCYCLTLRSEDGNGDTCVYQKCNITVAANPVPNFTFSPTEGCIPLTVTAQCNSTPGSGTIDSMVIDWGCIGQTYYTSCPTGPVSVTYTAPSCSPGEQSPNVIIKNSYGCYAEQSFPNLINLIPDPVASFAADTTYANCTSTPLTVHFTATNADPNITYTWYINSVLVQFSTSRFLTYAFPPSDSCYNVKLVVSHPSGCSDSITKSDYICVTTSPVITYTQNITNACINGSHSDSLILNNTSIGTSSLTWQLTGPGPAHAPITGPSASFLINTLGTYDLTATGVFAPGCTRTVTQEVLQAHTRPVAGFTPIDTYSCQIPFVVDYAANECAQCTYNWTFYGGNPGQTTLANPVETYTSYVYGSTTLVTIDTDGCSDTVTASNNVSIVPIHPTFAATHQIGCPGLCTKLQNTTPLFTPGYFSSVCWSFPNSNIAGSCSDSIFCFNQPGCYNVKMVVTTNTGCSNSVSLPNYICVANPPINTVTVLPAIVCYHDSVTITITGDTFTFCKVNFGDNTGPHTYTSSPIAYAYTDTGHFCISVITFRDSCQGDSVVHCVTVNPPIANFADSTTCRTTDTVFLNNSSVGATNYKWYFCTGDSSALTSPFKLLPYCDTCSITLVAYNSTTGCQDRKKITIHTACDSSSFNPIDTQGCAPFTVRFANTSYSIIPGFTAWDWDCNNGTTWTGPGTSAGNSATNTFTAPGTFCIAMRNESAGGCIDTVYGSVSVCKITANFGFNSPCFPTPICFSDSSSDLACGAFTWHWSFGDDSTSNLQNPCHLFPGQGTYTVKLVVTNAIGCKDSITKQVIVSGAVHVSLDVDTDVCPGTQICVANNSSGTAVTYNWTMTGATPSSSTQPSPCYTYNNPGTYPMTLTLSSNNQCVINENYTVHVHTPIAGGYASSNYIACPNPPQLITFHNTSQFADTLWHWNFGDGTFSDQQNASHIYLIPGVYLVYETVTDKQGCTNTAFIDTITVAGPYGTVSYTPTAGICACKDSAQFAISASDAINIVLLFGCNSGFLQITPNPIGTDSNPTRDTVMVPYCLRDSCTTKVVVDDATGCQVFLPDLQIYVDSPQLKIAFNSYGVCNSGTVCFYDSTTYFFPAPRSYTVSRLWDFGDGHTDTSINPCHYYSQAGVYDVKLYVHSNMGCFDSLITVQVIIPNAPVAGYYADTSFACANSPLCFVDTSIVDTSTAPAFWVWDFGDGTIDTVYTRNVCHTYAATPPMPHIYRIKDCVYDSAGCSDCSSATTITVVPNPVANAGGDQVVCYGAVTQLHGVGGTIYRWSPPSLFSNPNIADPTVTLFTDTVVTFRVSTYNGCTNTDTIALSLAWVVANFTVPHLFCIGNSVCVTDSSSGVNDSIISYEYNFGGIHQVSGRDNCYVFPSPGPYNISEIDIDNHGCTDTLTRPVIIFPAPEAKFSISDTVICSNEQICITDLSTSDVQITNWLWSYGDNSGSSLSSPPCHTYSAPYMHNYAITLIVTDQNNCTDSTLITETVNLIPQADFNWTTTCQDTAMPLLSTSTPGSGPISNCQWTLWLGAPHPVIDSNCYTSFLFPPGSHNVQLVVTDLNGCTDTIVKAVTTDSITTLALVPGDTTICLGSSIDYQVSGIFNKVNWANNIWLSNNYSRMVTINPLGDISYTVSVQNGVCQALSDSFSINVIQPIPIKVNAAPDRIVLGLKSNITSEVLGQIDSLVWSPDSTLNCRTCPDPVATPQQTTTYYVTAYYTRDGISCSNSAEVTIDVLNSCDNGIIYVPNTFTPNGDGLNDIFMIRGIAATKIDYFRVLDRWGRLVFEATGGVPNDPQFGWDGTDRQGRKLNPDVYVYTYEIQCINGNIVAGQGNVTLVR